VKTWLRASSLALSAVLIAASAHSQRAKTPFTPVPVDQRTELANRLADYTRAFRRGNWYALYNLVSDVNKIRPDGKRMSKRTFAHVMAGDDFYRLPRFTPIRTEAASGDAFDVYGCGEFPDGEKQPERIVVAVRAVREHDGWFFTAWDYPDPRESCSALSDPAWKPSQYLRLDYLPQVTCLVKFCTL
jgi:hypothetical protein